jgi:hypothetical protein
MLLLSNSAGRAAMSAGDGAPMSCGSLATAVPPHVTCSPREGIETGTAEGDLPKGPDRGR